MSKRFEFQFDEDEETWLTPQLSERSVGTQSKPVDLKEWFGQIKTSDRASLLSKKLQKYAQKRAARNERLRLAASSSLDVVAEADGSPEPAPVPAMQDTQQYTTSTSSLHSSSGTHASIDEEPESRQQPAFDSGFMNSSSLQSTARSCTSSNPSSRFVSSTPMTKSDAHSFGDTEEESLSPINSSAQGPSDSDEEFYDASSDFCEDVQNLLMASSLHEDQLGGNGMMPDDDSGISVVRNCMTQSLMKVEEESPMSQLIVQPDNTKPFRSSSVSPRSVSTTAPVTRPSHMNTTQSKEYTGSIEQLRNQHPTTTPLSSRSRSTAARPQARLSRPPTTNLRPLATPRPSPAQNNTSLSSNQRNAAQYSVQRVPNPKAQLLQTLISTPVTANKDTDRNSNNTTTPDNLMSRATSAPRPSPQSQDDIPDLAALREIARQQEEALRQAVEQQQHGYVERKHSWQNEAMSKSAHSSAGSLVSSKSVDMTTLHKVNANSGSKIPAPTRMPRKTGIPAPSKRVGAAVRCASAVPEPTDDDECF